MRKLGFRLGIILGAALAAALLFTAPAAAQSVRGQILDAQTGAGVSSVSVSLLGPGGERVATVISDANGRFVLLTRAPGEYRIQTNHVAYREVTTQSFLMRQDEQIVLEVRVTNTPIALDPLTIQARRPDPRHDATEEGFYARRLQAKPIGSARVMLPHDPELLSSSIVEDILSWMPRQRGCMVVFWNGKLVTDSVMARSWLETPISQLEGVEYYRTPLDAPAAFRELPIYLAFDNAYCSVIALWPRTGRYLAEYVPELPVAQVWDGQLATGIYQVSGKYAPGLGGSLEATGYRQLRRRLDLSLHLRATVHQLAAETARDMTKTLSDLTYVLPPGARTLQVFMFGAGLRTPVVERPRMRATMGARLQLAQRRFSMQSAHFGNAGIGVTSYGFGAGAGVGLDMDVTNKLSAHVALASDWLKFNAYEEIERPTTPTAAAWLTTGLRLGITYHRGR